MQTALLPPVRPAGAHRVARQPGRASRAALLAAAGVIALGSGWFIAEQADPPVTVPTSAAAPTASAAPVEPPTTTPPAAPSAALHTPAPTAHRAVPAPQKRAAVTTHPDTRPVPLVAPAPVPAPETRHGLPTSPEGLHPGDRWVDADGTEHLITDQPKQQCTTDPGTGITACTQPQPVPPAQS